MATAPPLTAAFGFDGSLLLLAVAVFAIAFWGALDATTFLGRPRPRRTVAPAPAAAAALAVALAVAATVAVDADLAEVVAAAAATGLAFGGRPRGGMMPADGTARQQAHNQRLQSSHCDAGTRQTARMHHFTSNYGLVSSLDLFFVALLFQTAGQEQQRPLRNQIDLNASIEWQKKIKFEALRTKTPKRIRRFHQTRFGTNSEICLLRG